MVFPLSGLHKINNELWCLFTIFLSTFPETAFQSFEGFCSKVCLLPGHVSVLLFYRFLTLADVKLYREEQSWLRQALYHILSCLEVQSDDDNFVLLLNIVSIIISWWLYWFLFWTFTRSPLQNPFKNSLRYIGKVTLKFSVQFKNIIKSCGPF